MASISSRADAALAAMIGHRAMKTRNYIALIRKEADSDYGVEFPDLPGCVTAGVTLDEAAAMAREALALHLEGMAEEGEPRPEPSSLEDVTMLAASAGAVPILVAAPRLKGRTVRINVTMDENLLTEIDDAAGTGARSRFLAQAARAALRGGEVTVKKAAEKKAVKRKAVMKRDKKAETTAAPPAKAARPIVTKPPRA